MLETSAGRVLPGSFVVLTAGLKVTMGGDLSSAPTPQSMRAACALPGPTSSMQVRVLCLLHQTYQCSCIAVMLLHCHAAGWAAQVGTAQG